MQSKTHKPLTRVDRARLMDDFQAWLRARSALAISTVHGYRASVSSIIGKYRGLSDPESLATRIAELEGTRLGQLAVLTAGWRQFQAYMLERHGLTIPDLPTSQRHEWTGPPADAVHALRRNCLIIPAKTFVALTYSSVHSVADGIVIAPTAPSGLIREDLVTRLTREGLDALLRLRQWGGYGPGRAPAPASFILPVAQGSDRHISVHTLGRILRDGGSTSSPSSSPLPLQPVSKLLAREPAPVLPPETVPAAQPEIVLGQPTATDFLTFMQMVMKDKGG